MDTFSRKGDPGGPSPVQEGLTFTYLPSEEIGLLATGVGISIFLQTWRPPCVLTLHLGPGSAVHCLG